MTSQNPDRTNAAAPKAGSSRIPLILLLVILGLLGALVVSFRPARPHLLPAPLVAYSQGCSMTGQAFVPTNVTWFPDPDLQSLPASAKNRVLLHINMEPCSCGCAQSIVACRFSNPECAASRKLFAQAVAQEKK